MVNWHISLILVLVSLLSGCSSTPSRPTKLSDYYSQQKNSAEHELFEQQNLSPLIGWKPNPPNHFLKSTLATNLRLIKYDWEHSLELEIIYRNPDYLGIYALIFDPLGARIILYSPNRYARRSYTGEGGEAICFSLSLAQLEQLCKLESSELILIGINGSSYSILPDYVFERWRNIRTNWADKFLEIREATPPPLQLPELYAIGGHRPPQAWGQLFDLGRVLHDLNAGERQIEHFRAYLGAGSTEEMLPSGLQRLIYNYRERDFCGPSPNGKLRGRTLIFELSGTQISSYKVQYSGYQNDR